VIADLSRSLAHADYASSHYVGEIGISPPDGNTDCIVVDVDLTTGTEGATAPIPGCSMILGIAISPDQTRAAVAYEQQYNAVRVAIVDLASDTVTATHGPLGPPRACDTTAAPVDSVCLHQQALTWQGMDWTSASTIRVALNRTELDPLTQTTTEDGQPMLEDDGVPNEQSLLIELITA
jgi:hypothetical protein